MVVGRKWVNIAGRQRDQIKGAIKTEKMDLRWDHGLWLSQLIIKVLVEDYGRCKSILDYWSPDRLGERLFQRLVSVVVTGGPCIA